MKHAPLLLEIGCEEIPSRMVRRAAADLGARVAELLRRGGIEQGERTVWSTPRRLAVRIERVAARQADRDEEVLGPPASAAFEATGAPTRAGLGFAAKHGVDPARLARRKTERGEYVAFTRHVAGQGVGELLARELPAAVAAMTFPKSMRWADGSPRWVRPVQWLLALHGEELLPLELFGIASGAASMGHRFLGPGRVTVAHADAYPAALDAAAVVVDTAERRRRLAQGLERAARELGGVPVPDPELLDEAADLVEWPGTVGGTFDAAFLDLPRELLVTTLRHHQKCFSVQDERGALRPAFVAVTNTDRDAQGHIRRGNEWVIGGRLEDARFFWRADSQVRLGQRQAELAGIVFHAKLGSYADKAGRTVAIAEALARELGLDDATRADCREAAALAKVDLVSDIVGEFPELQGRAGGLLLAASGARESVARAVYEHYRPVGAEDDPPSTLAGGVVSVADKLDTIGALIGAGETPTGSRDPFGLRRASTGIFRTVIGQDWNVSLAGLWRSSGSGRDAVLSFLVERFQKYLLDRDCTINEIRAVFRPNVNAAAALGWPLGDVIRRLEAIRTVRSRADFAQLVDLTKRVDNILGQELEPLEGTQRVESLGQEDAAEALTLANMVTDHTSTMTQFESERRYGDAVDLLARFVDPVERFFDNVLVLDPSRPQATLRRRQLLAGLRGLLTRCFDIRELAGQADRRPS